MDKIALHPYPQAPHAANIMHESLRYLGLPKAFKTDPKSSFAPLVPGVDEKRGKFSPSQYFYMFTNHMGFYRRSADYANKYAYKNKHLFAKTSKKTGKTTYTWKVISGHHVFLFVLVQIRMAICFRPTISSYWNDQHGDPVIKKLMSRSFYIRICKALSMYDPFMNPNKRNQMSANQTDNSYKCREMIDALNKTCMYFFHIGAHLSLDESIVPMHNRTTISQKFRNKVITKGARFFKIANPLGYVFLNILDCQYTRIQYDQFQDQSRKGSKIVLYCLKQCGLIQKRTRVAFAHVIYMDTYYMSIPLTHYLLKKHPNIYLNGTLRGNAAGKPPQYDTINGKKMVKGDLQMWTNPDTNLFLLSWFDTKLFQHITSVPHNPNDMVSKTINDDIDNEIETKVNENLDEKYEDYCSKTKKELQDICAQRALPKYANKQDLVDRLIEYDYYEIFNALVKNASHSQIFKSSNDSNNSNDNSGQIKTNETDNSNVNTNNDNNQNNNNYNESNDENGNAFNYMTKQTTDPDDINEMYKKELLAQAKMRNLKVSTRMKVDELKNAIRKHDGTENVQTNKRKSRKSLARNKPQRKPSKSKQIPKQVHEYRQNMIGVDQHDRLVLTMSVGRKTAK